MAATKTINLQVTLTTDGNIKAVTQNLEQLNVAEKKVVQTSKQLHKQQGETYRNMRGVSEATGRANKDFGRMSQGMGGLVQAYATVAANVFALSSAFLVLRRTADLSSMIKSAEDFSNRFGVSVTRITKQMQAASGGALSFADALPTINKAISAGIGTEKLEELTKAATIAAQTFGGTTAEALNRFISASQRGRVEIIQTLGIVIKTEQAYKDYAASIGKTALELTAFDRQQAILNATIEESRNVFDQVNIDPNPFQQLLTTIIDLKDNIATFVTDALTPLINTFNKSKAAAGALIALIVGSVAGRIFPALQEQIIGAQQRSVESTRKALAEAQKAKRIQERFEREAEKTSDDVSIKAIRKRDAIFRASLGDRIKAHKAFTQTIFNQENKLQVDVLTAQRAAIAREISARAKGKGQQKIFSGTSDVDLKKQLNTLNQIGASIDKANISAKNLNTSLKETTNTITTFGLKAKAAIAGFRAESARAVSLYKTGFAQTFIGINDNLFKSIGRVARAWGKFAADVYNFKGATILGSFGRAAGRTAGLLAGAFTKAIGALSSILVIVSLVTFAWEKWGDKIRGITPEMRAVITAGEEFDSALEEINDRTAEGIERLGTELPSSLKKLQDSLKFTAGTFASLNTAIINFRKESIKALNGLTPDQAIQRIQDIKKEISDLGSQTERQLQFTKLGRAYYVEIRTEEASRNISELTAESERLRGVLETISEQTSLRLNTALSQAFDLSKLVGFKNVGTTLGREVSKAMQNGLFDGLDKSVAIRMENALRIGSEEAIKSNLEAVKKSFGDNTEEFVIFQNKILSLISSFSSASQSAAITIDKSLSSLSDVENRLSNFISGLDKLKASSGPNKELTTFVLDTTRELQALVDIQKEAGENVSLTKLFGNGSELEQIKSLLGFAKGEFVDINIALERSKELQQTLLEQALARTVGAQQLKTLSIELNTAKSKEIKSDEDRLARANAIRAIEIDTARLKLTNLRADLKAQEAITKRLQGQEGAEQTLQVEEETLKTLEAQERALEQELKLKENSLIVERTSLDIAKERLDAQKTITNNILKLQQINRNLSANDKEDLLFRKSVYNAEKQILKIEEQKALLEVKRVQVLYKTGELGQRELDIATSRLEVIRAENRELERRELFLRAEATEQAGVSIFDREGLDLAAEFFVRSVRDKARNLRTTFEILGKGFVDVINDGFDKAVDLLLEGGRDFWQNFTESLKASLRDVFGEALKTKIRQAFAGIFTVGQQEQPLIKSNAELKTSIDQLNTTISSKSLPGMSVTNSTVAPIVDRVSTIATSTGDPEVVAAVNQVKTVLGTISSINEESLDTGKEQVAASKEGFFSIIQTLFKVITAIISAGASKVGGFFSNLFGAGAMGGMLPGKAPMARFANGGMVSAPQLALIGEGKTNEAVVPLPNNREIPVDLKGGTGDTINIEQNFDFRNASPDTINQLRTEARAIEERTFTRVFTEINKGGRYAKISGRR